MTTTVRRFRAGLFINAYSQTKTDNEFLNRLVFAYIRGGLSAERSCQMTDGSLLVGSNNIVYAVVRITMQCD